ncbi:MAG: hypothetical protein ABWZ25_16940 [Chitinophagaceae bacterium]
MRPVPLVLIALAMMISCQKEERADTDRPGDGRYVGIFTRTGLDTANVSLDFEGNQFSGSSSIDRYPAICGGSFDLGTGTIIFSDTCSWTANFDWSLIADGHYNFVYSDEKDLRIWKTADGITDEYRLHKTN